MQLHTTHGYLFLGAAIALTSTTLHCSPSRAEFAQEPDASVAPAPFDPPEASTTDGPREEVECSGPNTLIYVVATNPDTIYRFDPPSLTFTRLGELPCPVANAFSMAIDRFNNAWVVFFDGRLFKVRLDDLTCTEIRLRNAPPVLATGFGMGFLKPKDETGETLFMGNEGLWKADPRSLEVSRVGPVAGMQWVFELTGTGDGRLFGFTPHNGIVAQLDSSTAAVIESYRTTAVGSAAYAFAQWGGDFWLFNRSHDSPSSSVIRYSPIDRTSKVVVEASGIRILGAGSSTCAPSKPIQ